MFANLLSQLHDLGGWITSPLSLVAFAFSIWMFVDAIRRGEWLWAGFIFFFNIVTAILYFFLVYREAARVSSRGFELPGAQDRKRIKHLQSQIHHLDKAHHHSQLGDVYFQRGKLALAEQSYRAALERDGEDLDTRSHLGQCLLRLKRPEEALPLLEGVCAQDPKHDYGYSLMALAETHAALGHTEDAINLWLRVTEQHSYPRARVQLAGLYLGRNEPDKARALLQEVITEDPHTPAFQRKRDRIWVRRAKAMSARIPR